MVQLHDMYRPLPFPPDEVFRAFYECFVTSDAGRIVYETLLHDWVLTPVIEGNTGYQALAYINGMLRGYEQEVEHGRRTDGRRDGASWNATSGPRDSNSTGDDWDPLSQSD